jgi:hypothetical protein
VRNLAAQFLGSPLDLVMRDQNVAKLLHRGTV